MARIRIIDYGAGNLSSIGNALEYLGNTIIVSSVPFGPKDQDFVVLPGVGSFGFAMDAMQKHQTVHSINEFVQLGGGLLGICLGMQLMLTTGLENGESNGLGLISGEVVALPSITAMGQTRLVPRTEWATISQAENANDLPRSGLPELLATNSYYYFCHSYHVRMDSDAEVMATTDYTGFVYPAIIRSRNIFGVQFHPEKSGLEGLKLLNGILNASHR